MPEHLLPVLDRAFTSPFTTKSDFARKHVDLIAEAACQGLITIFTPRNHWGRVWHITAMGLQLLENTPND